MARPLERPVAQSSAVEEYARTSPRSAAVFARARELFPAGVTHDVRATAPFPPAVVRAEGARKLDADGRWLVDYVMGHGALLLGHSHPEVVEALARQAGQLLHAGGSTEQEARWAELVTELVPSAERVRFTSSGTEATLLALRVARGFTGRTRVLKLGGHFHGWHDDALPGVDLPVAASPPTGSPANPDLTVVPAGDLEALAAALSTGDVAALILEPSGAAWGAVPLPDRYLEAARALCDEHGALLVYDEVVTGFRWSPGGVQALAGVLPDLTALAKVLAGGMPGGALAGRADVMEVLGFPALGPKVDHPGTHNGHPLAAVAGAATLELVAAGEPGAAAESAAKELRAGLNDVLGRRGVRGFAYGQSSTFCLILGHTEDEADEVTLKRGLQEPVASGLHCAMLLEGVHLFHGCGLLSSAHGGDEVEHTVDAFERSITRLQAERLLS